MGFASLALLVAGCSLLEATDGLSGASDAGGLGNDDAGDARDAATTPLADAAPDASVSGEGGHPDADAECPVIVGASPCSSIPHFTGTQAVDGIGNEFCDIVATEFDVGAGSYGSPPNGGSGVNTKADIRVGWSSLGLHIHVHVIQAKVTPPPSGTTIYFGDAIEVFASATAALTGRFGQGADPAIQVIATPASGSQPALSSVATSQTGITGTLEPSQFAGRLVPGGYEVEFQLPWSLISGSIDGGPPPGAGSRIGFDVACDIQAPDGTRLYQSSLSARVPTATGACNQDDIHPSCDDQTWCAVDLSP